MAVLITINGDGLSYEGSTTLLKASQIIGFLGSTFDLQNEHNSNESAISLELPLLSKVSSPREAIIKSGAKTNAEKIAVLGDYVCTTSRKGAFSISEVRALFAKAGEAAPGNISRDIKTAITLNYIYEDNNRVGEYLLTDAGMEAVKDGFKSTSRVPTVARSKRLNGSMHNKNGIKVVSDDVKKLQFVTTLEGFPNYWDITVKRDRILWLYVYAENKGITELSPADVEYMASQLKDHIPTSSFSALIGVIFKKGYIVKVDGGRFKILQPGIDYLTKLSVNKLYTV